MNWQECDSCGHSFTDGYFTEDALTSLFSKAHEYQLPDPQNVERLRYYSARRLDRISSVIKKQEGKWLEVGFGDGSLMTTCEEYGFEPIGIDLRSKAVEKIKQFGYEAHCIDFNEYCQFEGFAVISMPDVLEHMPYPKEALEHANGLLVRQGALFIACPNSDSFLWTVLTKVNRNPYWIEIEHYHNFGRSRLYSLLIENGFRPANYSASEVYRVGMEVIAIKETEV
jgi:SAM-dependent methyltransferase